MPEIVDAPVCKPLHGREFQTLGGRLETRDQSFLYIPLFRLKSTG
jgi:hypothetical protein